MRCVTMTGTHDGSPDGVGTVTYHAGQSYAVPGGMPAHLAAMFVRYGWATEATAPEQKSSGPAPENKALGPSPENKTDTPPHAEPRRRGRPPKAR